MSISPNLDQPSQSVTDAPGIKTIAIDAMGGDFGPEITVPAVIAYLDSAPDQTKHKFILVGKEPPIQALVKQHNGDKYLINGLIRIHFASQEVGMDELPAAALKKKKDSSMRVAINLVKEGIADAAVSAGNTGALMATARFVLKTIPGINRPAIISTLPNLDTSTTTHMLDLGANVDSSPEMLMQFAVMGSVLTQYIDKKAKPRVALLNVGAEEIKGSEKVKKASTLLADSTLNYVGYVEADEIYTSRVDVIVCDGFEGNVALKASEGTASLVFGVIKEEFTLNILSKFIAWLCKPMLERMRKRLDPRLHNGATLIGLNGIVIKSHGGTDQLGFLHAIGEAARQAEMDVIEHLRSEVSSTISS